jgi:hypothetical protein
VGPPRTPSRRRAFQATTLGVECRRRRPRPCPAPGRTAASESKDFPAPAGGRTSALTHAAKWMPPLAEVTFQAAFPRIRGACSSRRGRARRHDRMPIRLARKGASSAGATARCRADSPEGEWLSSCNPGGRPGGALLTSMNLDRKRARGCSTWNKLLGGVYGALPSRATPDRRGPPAGAVATERIRCVSSPLGPRGLVGAADER